MRKQLMQRLTAAFDAMSEDDRQLLVAYAEARGDAHKAESRPKLRVIPTADRLASSELDGRSAEMLGYFRQAEGDDKRYLLAIARKCAERGDVVRPALRAINGGRA
jgi:hypothetical protein